MYLSWRSHVFIVFLKASTVHPPVDGVLETKKVNSFLSCSAELQRHWDLLEREQWPCDMVPVSRTDKFDWK